MKKFFHIFFITAIVAVALVLTSGSGCKNQPTQNDTTHKPPPVVPDTTSHNFMWALDTIGIQGQLSDVAIINDTDAWAVGEIYLYDSAAGHEDPTIYNAAHWDGHSWKPIRIWWDSTSNGIEQLNAIYAFGANDIWVGRGGLYHWLDGRWIYDLSYHNPNQGAINRIWGLSNSDFYLAENNGYIVHWDGSGFSSIPSGTTLPIVDIYGDTNDITGQMEIAVAASDGIQFPEGKDLYHLSGTTVTSISDSGLSVSLTALWFKSGKKYVLTGGGVAIKSVLQDTIPWNTSLTIAPTYSESVCGQDTNDIMITGDYGAVEHYNGRTWRAYSEVAAMQTDGRLVRVQMKGNIVLAVGQNGHLPIALIGKR